MKRVTYILGAGFSAPLGIPTIARFLSRAKDLLQEDPQRFGYFMSIFGAIQTLQVANNYFSTDIESIEDLLTLQDFKGAIGGQTDGVQVKQFITDVINSSLMECKLDNASQRWNDLLFWGRPWCDYGPFVAALLGYEFELREKPDHNRAPTKESYVCREVTDLAVDYSVVTLNYDRVLEMAQESINHLHRQRNRFVDKSDHSRGTPLFKLHGSLGSGHIIPPLWNKTIPSEIRHAWKGAFEVLSMANEIRVIGYSLPETDPYVRYLLRTAAAENQNLKRFDVLCADDEDHTVEQRYRRFVRFRGFRFQNSRTESYLGTIGGRSGQWPDEIDCQRLVEDSQIQLFGH